MACCMHLLSYAFSFCPEKSAAGRAARAQMEAMAKQSANPNKGEPVLKWQMN